MSFSTLGLDSSLLSNLARAAIVTATAAYTVDLHVSPKRLRPGFENRLSNRSLFLVYGTFALGLAGLALIDCYRPPRGPVGKGARWRVERSRSPRAGWGAPSRCRASPSRAGAAP